MKKRMLFVLSLAMIFTSCTLTEHIQFNNDFSGNVEYTIDYSWYTSMMEMADTSEVENLGIDSILKESMAEGKLDSFEGISNFVYVNDSINKFLIITYDFANLDALNTFSGNSQNIENTLTGASQRDFSVKGKKFSYKSPLIAVDTLGEDLEEFKDFYNYKLILSFNKEVKKINNTNATLSEDKKKVTLEGDLFTLFSKEYNSDLIINLK